jgi:hypothetical protein
MIYLLLEEENNLINSVITKLSSKMRDSSVVRLHRKIEESDVLKYKQPPMFDNGWFIVYDGNNNSVIKTLCSYDKNVTIVQAHTYSAGEKLMSDMVSASLSFKVIDNLKIPKEEKLAYIRRELSLSETDVNYLYNRTRGYTKNLVQAVLSLKALPQINRSIIKAVVPKTSRYGLGDVFLFLIGADTKIKYEECIEVIYRYRYATEFLKEFLQKNIKAYLEIYELLSKGTLTLYNYKELRLSKDYKILTTFSEYQLYKVIERYKSISYEYLYFLSLNIAKIPSHSRGILAIINLLQTRKEL